MVYNKFVLQPVLGIFFSLVFFGSCTLFASREYDLSEPFVDVITSRVGVALGVESAEFVLEGYFSGYGRLFLSYRELNHTEFYYELARRGQGIKIEGTIDYCFVQPWYLDSVGVLFFPIEAGEGRLRVRFRRGGSPSPDMRAPWYDP